MLIYSWVSAEKKKIHLFETRSFASKWATVPSIKKTHIMANADTETMLPLQQDTFFSLFGNLYESSTNVKTLHFCCCLRSCFMEHKKFLVVFLWELILLLPSSNFLVFGWNRAPILWVVLLPPTGAIRKNNLILVLGTVIDFYGKLWTLPYNFPPYISLLFSLW